MGATQAGELGARERVVVGEVTEFGDLSSWEVDVRFGGDPWRGKEVVGEGKLLNPWDVEGEVAREAIVVDLLAWELEGEGEVVGAPEP